MPINITSRSRNFCFSFTIGWLLVIILLLLVGTSRRQTDSIGLANSNTTLPHPPCRLEFFDSDHCHFVQNHCSRIDDLGFIPYLKWYYCAGTKARAGLLVALLIWLVIVFAAMATAADKFLAVNLASLVHSLSISENLAGVTIFAFGNGSSDLFSTLAAMNNGNGSLAIAELFGAAAFITTMVLGGIAIIKPFSVDRNTFLADVACFILAASVNLILISDGVLELWECFVIIGMYISFVAFVLIRDRSKSQQGEVEPTPLKDELLAEEHLLCEVEETTALIQDSAGAITYVSKGDERKPTHASGIIVIVENIIESGSSHSGYSSHERSEVSSLSDWASEYEHMADIPPFIKMCIALKSLHFTSVKSFFSKLIRFPATVMIGLTTITQPEIEHGITGSGDSTGTLSALTTSITREPERHPQELWLLCTQLILGPQFLAWILWTHTGPYNLSTLYFTNLGLVAGSLALILFYQDDLLHPSPHLHVFLSTFGFLTATAWIYVLASEAVALIETLGVISDINDALLGATIFAIGNSSDDIFANLSVAKRGHPVLASSACLGGPMLNTLLGIGFGSLIQVVRGNYQPYQFTVPASLFVSAASLLSGLSVVLAYVLLRGGKLDKFLGYSLMTLWVGFTAVNVYVSTRS